MKMHFYLLAILTLTFASCENDELLSDSGGPRQLDYYIETFEIGLGVRPKWKVQYEYDSSGKLSKYMEYGLNSDSNLLEGQRYFVISYNDNRIHELKGYLWDASSSYLEYEYAYLPDGSIEWISENNHAAGITSEATFYYNKLSETIKVVYTYSNGGVFEYEFKYSGGNILSDKLTRGVEQLCSEGQYTYDSYINPFSHLGYVDYLLNNLSVNNKLTENVNYAGCSFPTLRPESYSYEYDEKGYPTLAIVNYISSGAPKRSYKEFFYRNN